MICVTYDNNMHICAFMVPHMHKTAFKYIFGLAMHTYAHIYTYLHTLYMKVPHRSKQLYS